ncbi:MAG: ketoacyl-ACP synthase III [Polyangiaceae bacterium]|nr:ketoacyl-ACP synthase III [Polyangiaceae bacterium]
MYLHGLGHFHPENVLSNAFLESLDIGTTDEWILSRVGIRERRTVLPLDFIKETRCRDLRAAQEAAIYPNRKTGARAATMALGRAGVEPGQIGLVLAGGCSPDMCIPAEAATIAKELGIECPAIDFSAACSSFGAQLHFFSHLGDAAPDFGLVVVPENITRVVDYTDRTTAILFGDATAAAVISTRVPSKVRVTHTSFGSAPSGADDVWIRRTGHFGQNGARVQKFAIKRMSELHQAHQEAVGPERRPSLYFIGHQANLTMLKSVAGRCDVAEDRHLFNIVHFGNQSSAGAPAVLSQRWDDLRPGDRVSLNVVGSGLSWASALFELD